MSSTFRLSGDIPIKKETSIPSLTIEQFHYLVWLVRPSIPNKRLYKLVGKENKLREEQAGFRKGYSAKNKIFTTISIIQKDFNWRQKLYPAFTDQKRAFHSVDREKLWCVLCRVQVSTKMVQMLNVMYLSVQASFNTLQASFRYSHFFDCPVRQRCLASPLILSFIINDLMEGVHAECCSCLTFKK